MTEKKRIKGIPVCFFIGVMLVFGVEQSFEDPVNFSVSELTESTYFICMLNDYDTHLTYIESRLSSEKKKHNWIAGATVTLNAVAEDMDAAGDRLTAEDYKALGQDVLIRLEALLARTELVLVKIREEVQNGGINLSEEVIYGKIIPRCENAIQILINVIQDFKDHLEHCVLISDYASKRVIELELNGTVVWNTADFGITFASFFDGERLENGTTLIGHGNYPYTDRVIKVEPGGSYTVLADNLNYPMDIELLSSGNIMIAEYMEGRVKTVDPNGDIHTLIDLPFGHRISDVEEKNDGNILIAVTNTDERIIEIDPYGNMIQTVAAGLNRPMDIEILNNGNLLITELITNRVIEIDSAQNIVWNSKDVVSLSYPFDAERLHNGHTLIADYGNGRVIEVDANGNIFWNSKDYGITTAPIDVEIVR